MIGDYRVHMLNFDAHGLFDVCLIPIFNPKTHMLICFTPKVVSECLETATYQLCQHQNERRYLNLIGSETMTQTFLGQSMFMSHVHS